MMMSLPRNSFSGNLPMDLVGFYQKSKETDQR